MRHGTLPGAAWSIRVSLWSRLGAVLASRAKLAVPWRYFWSICLKIFRCLGLFTKIVKDQRKRLTRLNDDHKELSQEFTKFRKEKEDQESLRNKQFKSLEDKISSLQQVDDEKINQLNKQIEGLEN